eukprot:jgi/Psemu1/25953/gm1.25953_g
MWKATLCDRKFHCGVLLSVVFVSLALDALSCTMSKATLRDDSHVIQSESKAETKSNSEVEDSPSEIPPNKPKINDITRHPKALNINDPVTSQSIKGFVVMIMISGRWWEFNKQAKQAVVIHGHCLMFMLVHHDDVLEDFQTSWIDEKTFNIKLQ